jgi:hypothetical protein
MFRPRFPRRARLAVGLGAAVAALITAAVIASAGSAQGNPHTLNLVATAQKHVGFSPHHRPRQGDRFGFGDKITGDDTGVDRAVCTSIGKAALCNVQAQLSKGKLSLQGIVPNGRATNLPIAVTGGTGAYDGASGTAIVTQVSHNKTNVTVNLIP